MMIELLSQTAIPWQAMTFLGVWLLGLSFAAGRALTKVSEHSRRLDEQSRAGERLGKLENDMDWVKGSLRRIERKVLNGHDKGGSERGNS